MKLKKEFGKRLWYLIRGIAIAFFSSITLVVYMHDEGQWFSRGAIYLYTALLFQPGIFIVSFFPELDERGSPKKDAGKKQMNREGNQIYGRGI